MASFLGENPKVYVAGEEGSPLPSVTRRPVRIEEIRAQYNKDRLWEDPDFPAVLSSIGAIQGDAARGGQVDYSIPAPETLRWVRPYEVCRILHYDRPVFAAAEAGEAKKCSDADVSQGTALGDCWYVAGLQALTLKPDVLDFVIPADNFTGFDDDKYCGAFHFRFYTIDQGKWLDIVVDDRIPWRDDIRRAAMAGVTRQSGPRAAPEYWVALIEKAYAKMHGSYAAISGGFPSQGLENFSNGFGEIMDLKKVDTHNLGGPAASALFQDNFTVLKNFLLSNIKGSNFMAVDSYADEELDISTKPGYGNYPGLGLDGPHAYTIQDVQEVAYNPQLGIAGSRVLVKLKNPWGYGEWKGAYSDIDDIGWRQMAKDLRTVDASGNKNIDEGAFWIDLHDLIRYFHLLEICHFGLTEGTKPAMIQGVWPPAIQEMPPVAYKSDYLRFKAYKFEVKQGPQAAKYGQQIGTQALICFTVAMQGYNSLYKPGVVFKVNLYKMTSKDQPLQEVVNGPEIREEQSVGREASAWVFVEPGWYVIIPRLAVGQAQSPGGKVVPIPHPDFRGKEIGYTIRVFAENETKIEEVSEDPAYGTGAPPTPNMMADLDALLRQAGLGGLKNLRGTAPGGFDLSKLANLYGGAVQVQVIRK